MPTQAACLQSDLTRLCVVCPLLVPVFEAELKLWMCTFLGPYSKKGLVLSLIYHCRLEIVFEPESVEAPEMVP